ICDRRSDYPGKCSAASAESAAAPTVLIVFALTPATARGNYRYQHDQQDHPAADAFEAIKNVNTPAYPGVGGRFRPARELGFDSGDVGLGRILDTLRVVAFTEVGHNELPLEAAGDAVGQLVLKVAADLCEILSVFDGNKQQRARVVFRCCP